MDQINKCIHITHVPLWNIRCMPKAHQTFKMYSKRKKIYENKSRKRKANVHIPMDKTKTRTCFIPLIFRLKEKQKHVNKKLFNRDFPLKRIPTLFDKDCGLMGKILGQVRHSVSKQTLLYRSLSPRFIVQVGEGDDFTLLFLRHFKLQLYSWRICGIYPYDAIRQFICMRKH